MMQTVRALLHEWVQLLYWVFFKPTALRAHVNAILPGMADAPASLAEMRHLWHDTPQLRQFVFKTVVFTALTWLISAVFVAQLGFVFGFTFDLTKSLVGLAIYSVLGVAAGVAFGVAAGVARGVAFGVAFGVAAGVAFGVAGGVAFGVAGVAGGVAGGVALGVAGGVAFGVAGGVAGGVALGVAAGVEAGVALGVAFGVAFGVAACASATRLPFYVFELGPALLAYRRSLGSRHPEQELLRSPVYFDDLLVLPQPWLAALLLRVCRHDIHSGLQHLGYVAGNPFQCWAVQRALRTVLETDRQPFFTVLDRLLLTPTPYRPVGYDNTETRRAADRYFTTRVILAELADTSATQPHKDAEWIERFIRAATLWLRQRGTSPYQAIARAYVDLLGAIPESVHAAPTQQVDMTALLPSLDTAVAELAALRHLPHGEHFYHTLHVVRESWRCTGLPQIAQLRNACTHLLTLDEALRSPISTVFRHLREATIDATAFLTAAHEITQRDALLKAQSTLEDARRLATAVYEPERSLLLAVIEHWRRLFATEGGRVAEHHDVAQLPNPYIAGRPIRPQDGQLFAGRRDEFRQIEETLRTGVGIVLYGQRRIGKTSILLHLHEHLPHHLLPVYLNLQTLLAHTTGGLLRAVAATILQDVQGTLSTVPALPTPAAFDREPYLQFHAVLEAIAQHLAPEQRVLLSFDEFEELEIRVTQGKVEPDIFTYLRGLTQTASRFALLFAGLHTLEQMTRAYWHPFFGSVQTIRIGYLSELDARQLITDPLEQFPLRYEEQALERIVAVTRAHPYLTQSLCHNLVNRLNDPLYHSNRATVTDVDAVLARTLDRSGYYFEDYVWGWSTDDERLVLSLLAEMTATSPWAPLAGFTPHLSQVTALTATQRLVERGIISERSEGSTLVFCFDIPLVQMWVQQKKSSARLLLEREAHPRQGLKD